MTDEPVLSGAVAPGAGASGGLPFGDDELAGSFVDRVRRVGATVPSGLAVVDAERELTYAGLLEQADRWAARLRSVGVSQGSPVVLLMEERVPVVPVLLGVLASGGIVAHVDPGLPPAVARQQLDHVEATVVVADDRAGAEALTGARHVLHVLRPSDPWADETGPPEPTVVAADGCFLRFTSGSSGQAKCALIDHGTALEFGRELITELRLGPGSVVALPFPLVSGPGFIALFGSLLSGATLSLVDLRGRGIAAYLAELERVRATVTPMIPSLLGGLEAALNSGHIGGVERVIVGGERVTSTHVERLRRLLPDDATITHVLGSTETLIVAWHHLGPDTPLDSDIVPVGTAFPGKSVRIVDERGNPVREGQVGFIEVRGRSLPLGYWRTEDVDGVFGEDEAGVRRCRTGDIGRFRPDGLLEFHGRADDRVKIRGHRVEPAEVEIALASCPGVDEAIVLVRRPDDQPASLAAYVLAAAGAELDGVELRNHLARRLPSYAIPAAIAVLDELPRLPGGKVDRAALPESSPCSAEVATVDPLEAAILGIWRNQLPGVDIDREVDVFAVGAHSLDAAEVLVRIEQEFGIRLPMAVMLTASRVADLAAEVEHRRHVVPGDDIVVMNESAIGPSLFFIPPLQGSAFTLAPIVRAMGEDRTVLSCESPAFDGLPLRHSTVRELAGHFLAELRSVQPEGPYHLAGYSFGAVLAYEMAGDLVAQGEEVAYLAAVDIGPVHIAPLGRRDRPVVPRFPPDRPVPEAPLTTRLRYFVPRAMHGDLGHRVRMLAALAGLEHRLDWFLCRRDLRRHGRVRPELRAAYVWESQLRAGIQWRPRPYPGTVRVFVAEKTQSGERPVRRRYRHLADDPSLGWSGFAEDVVIRPIPGDHDSLLFDPNAAVVGRILREDMDVAAR